MAIKDINLEEIKTQITEDAENVKAGILAGLCKIQAVAKAIASIPPETLIEVAEATSNVVKAYGEVALAVLPAVEAVLAVVAPEEIEKEETATTSQPYQMAEEEKVEVIIGGIPTVMTQKEFEDYSFIINSL